MINQINPFINNLQGGLNLLKTLSAQWMGRTFTWMKNNPYSAILASFPFVFSLTFTAIKAININKKYKIIEKISNCIVQKVTMISDTIISTLQSFKTHHPDVVRAAVITPKVLFVAMNALTCFSGCKQMYYGKALSREPYVGMFKVIVSSYLLVSFVNKFC